MLSGCLTLAILVLPAAVSASFCPDFLASEKACTCFSNVDGAVIECDGPDGPAVVEKLKNTNIDIRQLSITNADIIEIGPRAFRNIKVKSLVLDYNRIKKIHADAFRGLELSLVHLSISHNKLTEVPTDSIAGLTNLQTLDLKCNSIGNMFTSAFRNVTNIIELNLSCNQICKISREAFDGIKENLQSLILDTNCLKEVPAESLRGFKNILAIHLQFNQIESLDKLQFMNMLSLLMVRLSGNQIRTVDKQAFNNIPNLRYLFLDRNKLTSIEPNTLQQFKLLEIVDLSYNNIAEIPSGTFSNTEHLMQLNLEGNMISDIAPGAFTGSPLLLLLLGQNCLSSVTQQTFQGIPFLRQLSLTNNNLRLIQPFSFAQLAGLQLLDLTSNRLESIQPAQFTFSQQATVLLQENPVVCSQGFHIIQGGQGIHLLDQEDEICSDLPSKNDTCPTRKKVPEAPLCCSGSKQNSSTDALSKLVKLNSNNSKEPRLPVLKPSRRGDGKGQRPRPKSRSTTTTTAAPADEDTAGEETETETTTTIATPRRSSHSRSQSVEQQQRSNASRLNLERFWRLTAAPKTVVLNRNDVSVTTANDNDDLVQRRPSSSRNRTSQLNSGRRQQDFFQGGFALPPAIQPSDEFLRSQLGTSQQFGAGPLLALGEQQQQQGFQPPQQPQSIFAQDQQQLLQPQFPPLFQQQPRQFQFQQQPIVNNGQFFPQPPLPGQGQNTTTFGAGAAQQPVSFGQLQPTGQPANQFPPQTPFISQPQLALQQPPPQAAVFQPQSLGIDSTLQPFTARASNVFQTPQIASAFPQPSFPTVPTFSSTQFQQQPTFPTQAASVARPSFPTAGFPQQPQLSLAQSPDSESLKTKSANPAATQFNKDSGVQTQQREETVQIASITQ